MKNAFKICWLILFTISINLITSCKKDKPIPPMITTTAISDVTYTSAASGGNVSDEGSSVVISMGICWNTSSGPTIQNTATSENVGMGAFVSRITLLIQNTKYYVRAYASNSAGTSYGNEVTFTTNATSTPLLTTTAISSITQSSAAGGGNITSDNGEPVTGRGVCWSLSNNPTIADSKTSDGTGLSTYVSNITGLSEGTLYHIRSYATNLVGTAYGEDLTFTTLARPTLTTSTISSITLSSAISGGNITSNGGTAVIERGICWNTNSNPTISDIKISNGSGEGIYSCILTDLMPNSACHVRAYATNSVGTNYGNELIFKTYTISDFDNNYYYSVIIGTQTWMTENLRTTHYNNGIAIPLVTDNTQWNNLTTPAFCWYNNDEVSNKKTYGALYNWYSASSANLCPIGWHVPTDSEWTTLLDYLGGSVGAANKLKETGTTHWGYLNAGVNNETGFTAVPAGDRGNNGIFGNKTLGAFIWHPGEFTTWSGQITYIQDTPDAYIEPFMKEFGASIRCLKN